MTDARENTSDALEIQAADGGARYPAVTTMTDLIHMLGDGQFNADCAPKLKVFAEEMECIGCDTGKKVKGKITLSIEVEREHDGVYFFTPQIKTALPPENHGRTIGWVTEDNRFPEQAAPGQPFRNCPRRHPVA
mgnify:CR=1 FL=1